LLCGSQAADLVAAYCKILNDPDPDKGFIGNMQQSVWSLTPAGVHVRSALAVRRMVNHVIRIFG
jgi:hypothetical protein